MTPWSQETVDYLNHWQLDGIFHPYTCGWCRDNLGTTNEHGEHTERILTVTEMGFVCQTCGYTQNWYVGEEIIEEI